MQELPYDSSDPHSIARYAKQLIDISLRESLADTSLLNLLVKGKGTLGQMIEEYYFYYKPNSTAGPDFPDAGLELKTTPLLSDKKAIFKAKERLVFNIINYETEHSNEFQESSFWKKNQLLLLMFFLYEREKQDIDQVFKLVNLFRFPAIDLKIIKDDWEKIREKIRTGKAHEISEGDTFYLGACTKGANSNSTRRQPYSDIQAKQRAYSLKPKYVNIIIQKILKGEDKLIDETEGYRTVLNSLIVEDPLVKYSVKSKEGELSPIVKTLSDYKRNETIEDLIIRLFQPFYGYSENDLFEKLNLTKSKAKSRFYNLAKAILNVNAQKIEEFEKADIQLKTIILEPSGKLKESMSFPQIKYTHIIEEKWEDSEFFEQISKRFFFVIFKKNINGEPIFKKVMFWNMKAKDLETIQHVWLDTQSKISKGDFNHFIKISNKMIGHVRPKAANALDTMLTHLGTYEKKKCFWLNSDYVLEAITG
ncbi:MutH/Sau3AI family endonuclease [Pedobacter frigiditerrae]|uniref:MutH/Sau3AI family endonuclease n=1 Tax=Pedobacter frigiditerrae TaxID=2530452 RepID=UPI00292CC177|nr:MutH/Sau3AI family endonuclease [Pedobacter frigiditerrae]